jgi:hypothetical protein
LIAQQNRSPDKDGAELGLDTCGDVTFADDGKVKPMEHSFAGRGAAGNNRRADGHQLY